MLPSKDKLTICFAHVAYQLQQRFLSLATGINSFEVRDAATLHRIDEAFETNEIKQAGFRLVPETERFC